MTQLTITKALKNVRQTIEEEQGDLDLDQACTIYDLCQALNIKPNQVLDQTTVTLIDADDPRDRRQKVSTLNQSSTYIV